MNTIDEIKELYVKTQTFKIPLEPKDGEKQISLEFTPIDLEQSAKLSGIGEAGPEEKITGAIKMISLALGLPEDAVKKISIVHMTDIMACIEKVCGTEEAEKHKEGVALVKERQKQIAEQMAKKNAK